MKSRYIYPIPFNEEIIRDSKHTAFISTISKDLEKTLSLDLINRKWPIELRTKPELLKILNLNWKDKIYLDGSPSTHNYENNSQNAIDFLVPIGTPVQSIDDGEIIYLIESSNEYGITPEYGKNCNVISILHPNNTMSEYIHLAQNSVSLQGIRLGDKIKKGQIIGYTGASGRMDLPHLHFALYKDISSKNGLSDWISSHKPQYKNINIKFLNKKWGANSPG